MHSVLNEFVEEKVIKVSSVTRRSQTPIDTSRPQTLRDRAPSVATVRYVRPDSAAIVMKSISGAGQTNEAPDLASQIKKVRSSSALRSSSVKKNSYQVVAKYTGRPQYITGYGVIKDKEIDYHNPVVEAILPKTTVSPYMTGQQEQKPEIRIEKSKLSRTRLIG